MLKHLLAVLAVILGFAQVLLAADTNEVRTVIPAIPEGRLVDAHTLAQIYDEVKTPFKYGVVIRGGGTNEFVDCPSIFCRGDHWYMMYVAITNKVGYWLSYIGGGKQGYETDPLAIGLAWSKNAVKPKEWTRLTENPVLGPKQADARPFETKTLYKSQIIHDAGESLGWPFVMFYNGKFKNGYEQIGMAVSRDMTHWQRYGTNSVIVNGQEKQRGISGDPQIVKIGDVWVMFYFGAGWQPGAFDTFAASYDLVHWTKWGGANLIQSSEPYDKTYAHKPWVLKWQGVVYHFYCAVGTEGRVIAVATSRAMRP